MESDFFDREKKQNNDVPCTDRGYWSKSELEKIGFGSIGENVHIARNSTIVGAKNIYIGSNVRIDDWCSLLAAKGYLKIGSYVHIGAGCYLGCAGGISMDDFSGLSQGVKIYSCSDDYSGDFLTNPTVPDAYTGAVVKPVKLERHVIVGSGSVILPGVTIEIGSAIGALSLVSRSVIGWGIYSGTPARLIKERSKNLLILEQKLISDRFSSSKEL